MEETKKNRPTLPKEIVELTTTETEDFQNRVLRPLIKMQSDLLMAHLLRKLTLLKIDLHELTLDRQIESLTQLYNKDQAYRREVIGMVIGHLTLDEFAIYCQQSKELNRRIVQIVLQRAIDLQVSSINKK